MKWEYLVVSFRSNTDMHAALNDYGADRWELVSVTIDGGYLSTLFLKRVPSSDTGEKA